ncbi:hypothetical protein QXC87_003755 [Escherichia coli]|nr:hypothetical protein [Escherichia coli]
MTVNLNLKPKTPKKINAAIKTLLTTLNVQNTPQYLSLSKVPNARAGYCFNNCEDYAVEHNVGIVYGWMFWEDRKHDFTEAEFHAVILENGVFKDITPRSTNESRILFVPDMQRNHGRKGTTSWFSWTNIKMIDGRVIENTKPIEIIELDDDYSELIYL